VIINFESEECTECDVRIRTLNALYAIAKNELDQHGTTAFLLTIAKAIEKEAKDLIGILAESNGKLLDSAREKQ